MTTDETQVEKNTYKLLQFHRTVIRRRLKIEIDRMYPDYYQIIVSINEHNKLAITIFEYDEYGYKQKYEFILDDNYPFKPPSVTFQNRPYREFLRINYTAKELDLFIKITGHECLCCHSLTCVDNWYPGATLNNIIEEIRKTRKIKRGIVNTIFAEKIKHRYLVSDIDLESWLC